ncbi:hypothetical protein CAPTEDRAFT_209670 [Capitella teleta]|uniref:Uncharacterized protein n=1 Tax=Capitella teleta TaxID=283909 RepID=R7V269_CAPTE|nr:hypothetical protein CAPTEDRAFT_209670 [Capitella teleta]|eukprot:ELU10426.1 hypothetical protein CAPTEDRAFT_209670 [Capitella teleta]
MANEMTYGHKAKSCVDIKGSSLHNFQETEASTTQCPWSGHHSMMVIEGCVISTQTLTALVSIKHVPVYPEWLLCNEFSGRFQKLEKTARIADVLDHDGKINCLKDVCICISGKAHRALDNRQVMGALCRCVVRSATLFALFLIAGDLVHFVSAMKFEDVCSLENSIVCKERNRNIPADLLEVCDACGNFWGNIPGLSHCCTCNGHIFQFCLTAVMGGRR